MRTSEHIESDETFVRLFSPEVLGLLPEDGCWDRLQIFRSTPAGGKTTLFRIFTPDALRSVHAARALNEECRELCRHLKSLGVVAENGPTLLGIMLSCARNYANIEDLCLDPGRKARLFYSLLNARLVLAGLRGALALRGLGFPSDLYRLAITRPNGGDPSPRLPVPGSGEDLYEWACDVERQACETMDSFGPPSRKSLEGHDSLYALSVLRPECILCDGTPVAARTLILLDDVHRLTTRQRRNLLSVLMEARPVIGVWIAERREALSPNEVLGYGATTGREYGEPIDLEDYWRQSRHKKQLQQSLESIADRRARRARDASVIESFAGCLQDSLDTDRWSSHFQTALDTVRTRLRRRVATMARYREWLETGEAFEGTPREQAIAWRSLEILIERDASAPQLSFDFLLTADDLGQKESEKLRAAAEFFLGQEFNIPYYFGMSRLSVLASSNIDQFLWLAGALFEESISAAVIGRTRHLSPERQEAILTELVQQRWDDVPRRLPNGRAVQRFIECILQCARAETSRPTAPYAPGVTGIALSMQDRFDLIRLGVGEGRAEYRELIQVLSACVSQNLLEMSLDYKQGNRTWMLLYLNRWLCLYAGLPLHYGGWRPMSLQKLCSWLRPRLESLPQKRWG